MQGVFGEILQTKELERIQKDDPYIIKADNRISELFTKVRKGVSSSFADELDEEILSSINSYMSAAILYGMKVAFAFIVITENPLDFEVYTFKV